MKTSVQQPPNISQQVASQIPLNIEHEVMLLHASITLPNQSNMQVGGNAGKIIDFLSKGIKLDQLVFDALIESIILQRNTYSSRGYGYGTSVSTKDALIKDNRISQAITEMLKNKSITIENIDCAVMGQSGGLKLLEIVASTGRNFSLKQTQDILKSVPTSLYYREDVETYRTFFNTYANSFQVDTTILEFASQYNFDKFILKMVDKKMKLTQKCLDSAVKSKNLELVKLMLLAGTHLSEDILVTACKFSSIEMIKYILENKIVPTKKCFDAAINYTSDDSEKDDYGYRYRKRRSATLKNVTTTHQSEIIRVLKAYGYKITYNDVTEATKKLIKINDFESLGIKLDTKFLDVCIEKSFYPYKTNGITPGVNSLEKECEKSGNLTNIKKLVSQGVKPNIKCLQNVCLHKNNIQAVTFIMSKGIKPDLACIQNIAQSVGNRTLNLLLDEYAKNAGIELKTSNLVGESDDSETNDDSDSDSDACAKAPIKVQKKTPSANIQITQTYESEDDSDSEDEKENDDQEEVIEEKQFVDSDVDFEMELKVQNNLEHESEQESDYESDSEQSVQITSPPKPVSKVVSKKTIQKPIEKIPEREPDSSDSDQSESGSEESDSDKTESESDEEVPILPPPKKLATKKTVTQKATQKSITAKPIVTKPVKKTKILTPDSSSDEESDGSEDENIVNKIVPPIVATNTNTYQEIPDDYDMRVSRTLEQKVMTLLTLKAGTTGSFMFVRSTFLNYLIKQKLITNSNIKINKVLAPLVYKKENNVVDMSEFDKLTYNLMKNCKVEVKKSEIKTK